MPYFYGSRDGERVTIGGADARHLARSLRARPGELVRVIEAGRLLTVRLERVGADTVTGVVTAESEHRPEPSREVFLAVAMLPAQALELVLSRCTEAGTAGFLLVQAERSVARGSKPERWAAICREAAMLAGRLRVPEVVGPLDPREAVARARSPAFLDREGGPGQLEGEEPLTLFVGPEGGWTERELDLCRGRRLSLGPRNLRADTAALVGLALALRGR